MTDRTLLEDVRDALKNISDMLSMVNRPSFPDPDSQRYIEALGETIGYGAMMAGAQHAWRERLEKQGLAGGEFVAGPCKSQIEGMVSLSTTTLARVEAALAEKKENTPMTDEQIKHMVDRFLQWKLPEDFRPDGGIEFDPISSKGTAYERRREPVGTNLLTATQAEAMVRHMLEGIPHD